MRRKLLILFFHPLFTLQLYNQISTIIVCALIFGFGFIGIFFLKYATFQADIVKIEEEEALIDRLAGLEENNDDEGNDEQNEIDSKQIHPRSRFWKRKEDENIEEVLIKGETCPICGKSPSECTCGFFEKKSP